MFDFHMHTRVSFDSESDPREVVRAAEERGLFEICFTDHYDYNTDRTVESNLFSPDVYLSEYSLLRSDKVKIRHGVEFGLTDWNVGRLSEVSDFIELDYVIGSIHFVGGIDPYEKRYWEGRTVEAAFIDYLDATLDCVKRHTDFDCLGHLTYAGKWNSETGPLYYNNYRDVCDEIMKILAERGQGMEINTSGMDRIGRFMPDADFLKRFRELGGEIITVGSDAHNVERVGQYTFEAARLASEIFGGVYNSHNPFDYTFPISLKIKKHELKVYFRS